MKNFDLVFLQLEKIYDLWNEHIEKAAIFPHDFIRFCTFYIRCSIIAKSKGIHYDELLCRLLAIDNVCTVDSHKIFFIASLNDFIFNLTMDNLEVCAVQIFTIKDLINEHFHRLSLKGQIDLYYHISNFYFIKKEYREALNWIEKLQKLDFKNDFSGLQRYSSLISLVAKYELRKYDELEFDFFKIRQFLNAKTIIRPLENLVISYVERLINLDYSKDESTILNQFFHSLQEINDGNLLYEMTAKNALNYWATNKISIKNIPLLN